jgi:hypothetical protein
MGQSYCGEQIMATYSISAPDGQTYTIDGPAGASQAQVEAEVLKQYPNAGKAQPKSQPKAELGTPIYGDVPTVAGAKPNIVRYEKQPEAKPVTMLDRVKTLYEVPTALVAPILTEPASMAYGVGRSAIEGAMQGQMPTAEARDQYYRQAKEAISYQPSSPESQGIMQTIGQGLEASKLPPYIPAIGKIPSAIQSAPPVRPVVNNMAQALRKEGQMIQEVAQPAINKVAEIAQPVTSKLAEVLRKEPTMSGVGAAEVDLPTQRYQMAQQLDVPINLRKSQAERQLGQQKFESDIAKTYPETLGKDIIKSDLEQTDAMLKNFDAYIDTTGAKRAGQYNLPQVGLVVDKALVKTAAKAWDDTSNAYTAAREAGEMQAPVSYAPLEAYIAKQTPTVRTKLAPILDAVDEQIQLNDPKVKGARSGTIPINSVEDIYQFINKHYEPDSPAASHAIEMKKLINEMLEGKGGELYQKARGLRTKYAKEFEDVGYVDKLLRNKPGTSDRAVALEDVFEHSILKGSLQDTRNIAMVLKKTPEGQQAWKELQGQTIQHIKDLVTKNMTKDSNGQVTISPKRFNSIVNELDQDGKLDYIFGKQGAQKIRNLNEVASDTFDPLTGAVNYSGSGSAVIQGLERIAKATRLPGLGKIAEVAKNKELKKKVKESVNYTPESMAKQLKKKD